MARDLLLGEHDVLGGWVGGGGGGHKLKISELKLILGYLNCRQSDIVFKL